MAESEKKEVAAIAALAYEYVTSDVSVLDNDGIVAHVVNDSMFSGFARVVIYHNTGAGAVVVADSGVVSLTPS